MRCVLVVALLIGVVPTVAGGQGTVTFIPYIGAFAPMAKFQTNYSASRDTVVEYTQTVAMLFGAKLRVKASPNWVVEVAGGYAKSGFSSNFIAAKVIPISDLSRGSLVDLSGRVGFFPRRSAFYFLGGVGYMARGGYAWDAANQFNPTQFNKTNWAGLLGLGLNVRGTSKLGVDVTGEVRLHNRERVVSGFTSARYPVRGPSRPTQADFVFTVGIPLG